MNELNKLWLMIGYKISEQSNIYLMHFVLWVRMEYLILNKEEISQSLPLRKHRENIHEETDDVNVKHHSTKNVVIKREFQVTSTLYFSTKKGTYYQEIDLIKLLMRISYNDELDVVDNIETVDQRS